MTEDIIVFDLETRLNSDRFSLTKDDFKKEAPVFKPFNPDDVKVGNLKDQSKIDLKIAEAEQAHEGLFASALSQWNHEREEWDAKQADRAALYPGQSEICAIGWQMHGEEPVTVMIGDPGIVTELDVIFPFLTLFREVTESPMTAGGNYKFAFWSGNSKRESMFDYNHLRECVRRNKTRINHAFLNRPGERHSPWIDLAMEYFQVGAILPKCDAYPAYLSLDSAAQYVSKGAPAAPEGFPEVIAKSDLDITGAEFGECMDDPDMRDSCRRYLVNDLALTRVVADNSLLNLL